MWWPDKERREGRGIGGKNRKACRVLVGKPEESRPFQDRRDRYEDNSTIVDRMGDSGKDRQVAGCCERSDEPKVHYRFTGNNLVCYCCSMLRLYVATTRILGTIWLVTTEACCSCTWPPPGYWEQFGLLLLQDVAAVCGHHQDTGNNLTCYYCSMLRLYVATARLLGTIWLVTTEACCSCMWPPPGYWEQFGLLLL